ncbi:hypothetical protein FB45DRAFT_906235 [Roridomyces roridus]|uniref:Zn(2)-C6 fungal-type domain-containing protein n=1 Tax=Roridomyces roridus TaxID=1738132 RepID=A0AAD7C0V3_9AGAR|nr:hypothetical protein FB45DRAFT_906235 [Roridomyces roridus]
MNTGSEPVQKNLCSSSLHLYKVVIHAGALKNNMSHQQTRPSKPKPPPVPVSHGHRGYIACTNCRRRKVRCTIAPMSPPESPCEQCTKRNLRCKYLTVSQEQDAEPSREEGAQHPWPGGLAMEGASSSQHRHYGELEQSVVPLTHPYTQHQQQYQRSPEEYDAAEQWTATGFNGNMNQASNRSQRPTTSFISRPPAAPLPPNYASGLGSTHPHYYAQHHNQNPALNAEWYDPGFRMCTCPPGVLQCSGRCSGIRR